MNVAYLEELRRCVTCTEIQRADFVLCTHFVSGRNFGLFLINLCKELPYIVKQEIGLLQSGEVSALRHISFLYYVVCLSNPAKRTGQLPPSENPHTPRESPGVASAPFPLR